jgi:hypothetical protein
MAFGLQSGAVAPAWRGRGLYRSILERSLGFVEAAGAALVLLYTDKPELYAGHGFVVVPEHVFLGDPPRAAAPGAARLLSLGAAHDVALLKAYLANRAPASERFGLVAHGSMFLYNALNRRSLRLHHLPEADCIVASEVADNGALRIHDVIAPTIPALSVLLAELAEAPDRVEVSFPPDRLAWTPQAALPAGRADALMARGALATTLQREPLGLPPTAAF